MTACSQKLLPLQPETKIYCFFQKNQACLRACQLDSEHLNNTMRISFICEHGPFAQDVCSFGGETLTKACMGRLLSYVTPPLYLTSFYNTGYDSFLLSFFFARKAGGAVAMSVRRLLFSIRKWRKSRCLSFACPPKSGKASMACLCACLLVAEANGVVGYMVCTL